MRHDINKPRLFPCDRVPGDRADRTLIGIYEQRQEDRMLQRIRIPGGRLDGRQWHCLAGIARGYTPGTPLHLTTRQDIEIHDLLPGQVPAVQRDIAAAGLTCFGAAGDTFRNIIVCPCAGTRPGSPDLMPLAHRIDRVLRGIDGIYDLPRKFKISLSCGPDCGQPWIHDVGLVYRPEKGRDGFAAVVAGSLGAKPGTGVSLPRRLEPGAVLPFVSAVVRFFRDHGDRENRRRARLRHVRERMGDAVFLDRIVEEFESVRGRAWPEVVLPDNVDTFPAAVTLAFDNGDVTPAEADELARLAAADDFLVRINTHHRVIVFGRDQRLLDDAPAASAALAPRAAPRPLVVACPGTRWCARALVDTNETADRIRRELPADALKDTVICISGCPNGCAQPAVADIGLTGRVSRGGGGAAEVFDLYTGGGMGRDGRLAIPAARKVPAAEVIDEINRQTGRD